MIRPDLASRLQLLVGAARPPLIASLPDRELAIAPLQPGQAIDARVEQQTPSGHLVSLAGRTYEFKLPDGARPGDLLRLVYLRGEPRPTFALLPAEPGGTEAILSEAGRLLALLRESASEPSTQRLPQATPVFAREGPDVPQAPALLRQALSLSGLFYESHQAQWVMGGRSAEQLRSEPQGRLAPMNDNAPAPSTAVKPVTEIETPEQAVPTPPARAEAAAVEADLVPPRLPAHPDTHPIIRQQLAALESGSVVWRGDVWPGQSMEWQVADAPDPQQPEPAARTWRTRLKLTLPQLGEVEANIEIGSQGARLRVLADSAEHGALLRAHATTLAQRFAAAGVAVYGLEVVENAPA